MPKIEPPNATAAALVGIAGQPAPELPMEALIPIPPEPEPPPIPYAPRERSLKQGPRPHGNGPLNLRDGVERIEADNERLERELKEARMLIATLGQQLEEIKATRSTIEQRINDCIAQRDQAVREAGELRGALKAVAAVCAKYHHAGQD